MRTAVCLSGLLGGVSGKDGAGAVIPPSHAGEYIMRNVIVVNNADVFAHTWTVGYEDQVHTVFHPVSFVSETPPTFNAGDTWSSLPFSARFRELRAARFSRQAAAATRGSLARAMSRWESTRRCLQLVFDHEGATGQRYDAVFITRFDVAFYTTFDFGSLRKSVAYLSNWNNYPIEGIRPLDYENLGVGKACLDFWVYLPREHLEDFVECLGDFAHFHISPHRALYEYIVASGYVIDYTKYRWVDHEMVRRKELGTNM